MLDANIKTQLKTYLERLQRPIELVASLDAGAKAAEMQQMLTEIASLSPLIALRSDGTDARKPSFAVGRAGEPARVRFAGIPMGHEFTSLVLALLQAGGHPPKVEAAVIEQIKGIQGKFRFETFISLSCHNCPDVVQALNLMAVLNPGIESVMIDGALFQNEVEARKIMAVPTVFLNGEAFGQGRMTLEEILAKIDSGAAARDAASLNARDPYDVLVVGGGPGGAAAAIYAARKGVRTGVVAERFGGQVLDTLAIENLISVPHTEGPKLAAALEQNVREYEVDIMNLQRAEALIPAGEDGLAAVRLACGATLKAKSVIIATGARWREMNVPGEKEYRGQRRGLLPALRRPAVQGQARRGDRRRQLGRRGGDRPRRHRRPCHPARIRQQAARRRGAAAQAAQPAQRHHHRQRADHRGHRRRREGERPGLSRTASAARSRRLELEGIFVQIGLLPNTDWLKGTIELSPRGEIEVDARGQTSLPGVFAAGDATTVPYKQIIIAMGEGAKASLSRLRPPDSQFSSGSGSCGGACLDAACGSIARHVRNRTAGKGRPESAPV